jgi:hypothetical protein
MDSNKILRRLQEHRAAVEADGQKVIFIGLVGSQNYGLETENSDVDTRAIVVPSVESVIMVRPVISYTHIMENDEHCDVKQMSEMCACFKKQNMQYLELLFSKYSWVNPEYGRLLWPLFENREIIARLDPSRAVNCMAGMAMEKFKALEHPYPTIKWKIDKWGYDGKQLHHIIRMYKFMDMYMRGCSFKECLVAPIDDVEDYDILMRAKSNYFDLDAARNIANHFIGLIDELKKNFPSNPLYRNVPDLAALAVIDNAIVNVMKYAFKQELGMKI